MSETTYPKIVFDDSFYEILAKRRADRNAQLAAQGLPPISTEPGYISESQARAEAEARAKQRAANATANDAAKHAPPPPTRGPLCRAAKAKVAERIASLPGFERHSRKCRICRSPYFDAIEEAYLRWYPVEFIAKYFQFDSEALYRHARAAALDQARRQNVRWVVEQFIEQWRNVKITSAAVIRSIRALSCLDDKGRWTDLPKTHIVVRGSDATDAQDEASSEPEPRASTVELPEPNRVNTEN